MTKTETLSKNCLNSPDEGWINKPIHRFCDLVRLYEWAIDGKNTLIRPKLWKDPFENFYPREIGQDAHGKDVIFPLRDSLYCQCWNDSDESDAMWSIYCPSKYGVRVTTTPLKLLQGLCDAQSTFPDLSAYIGRVNYFSEEEILKMIRDPKSYGFSGKPEGRARSLLVKRRAFEHEHEVRLIYDHNDFEFKDDFYSYPFDPTTNLDELLIDPRLLDGRRVSEIKSRLMSLGFECPIRHSSLYKVPKFR